MIKFKQRLQHLGCAVLLMLVAVPAVQAALTIEITEGIEGAVPVAVVPFGIGAEDLPVDVSAVIAADLRRSGRFAPLPPEDLISQPTEAVEVNFRDWRLLNVDYLVIGRVTPSVRDEYNIEFQVFDVLRARQLAGYSVPAKKEQMRRAAHYIADIIYEALTGERGAFDTRIAYVIARQGPEGRRFELQIADSDGYNPQTILTSEEPVMSPAWSPDGREIAYVSFERGRAEIYAQKILTGKRRRIAAFPGINGAPSWSPDGTRLALTLSRDGNPEIYVLHLADGRLQRITRHGAIDTEPAWSPDGGSLVFTSDRGGSPQIYQAELTGGKPRRLTFEGKYNASPSFSPDGKQLVLVHRTAQGAYRIAMLDLSSQALRVLSDGRLDESPSMAPNGSMIIYATGSGNRGVLAAVSVDGRVKQRLRLQEGDVREPAWSPFLAR